MAPVALRVQIAEKKLVLQPELDARCGASDLPRDKGLSPARRLVVEENAVASEQAIRLAEIDGDPVGVQLGHAVR